LHATLPTIFFGLSMASQKSELIKYFKVMITVYFSLWLKFNKNKAFFLAFNSIDSLENIKALNVQKR